jgi:hypothetical protein
MGADWGKLETELDMGVNWASYSALLMDATALSASLAKMHLSGYRKLHPPGAQ